MPEVSGLPIGEGAAGNRAVPRVPIVDSQVHLFEPAAQARATERGHLPLTAEDVVRLMDDAGVDRAYLVPGGTSSNGVCVAARERYPDRFRVMGVIPLDRPIGHELVDSWAESGMAGARLRFPSLGSDSWLRNGIADWFWPRAAELGMPVMVWPPRQFGELADVAQRYPELRITIDHLGLFGNDRDEAVDAVVNDLLPLAALGNVAVKASALSAHTSEDPPFRNLFPALERVVSAFGPDRVFWGSDLTRLSCSYEDAIEAMRTALGFLDPAQADVVMGGGIVEWMRW
jgi:L-fuconolactonase